MAAPTLMEVDAQTGITLGQCQSGTLQTNHQTTLRMVTTEIRQQRSSTLRSHLLPERPLSRIASSAGEIQSTGGRSTMSLSSTIDAMNYIDRSHSHNTNDTMSNTPKNEKSSGTMIVSSNSKVHTINENQIINNSITESSSLHLSHSAWAVAAAAAGDTGFSYSTDNLSCIQENKELPLLGTREAYKGMNNSSEVESIVTHEIGGETGTTPFGTTVFESPPSLEEASFTVNQTSTPIESLHYKLPSSNINKEVSRNTTGFGNTTPPSSGNRFYNSGNGNVPIDGIEDGEVLSRMSIWIVQFFPLVQKASMIRDFINCEQLLEALFESPSLNTAAFAAR